MRKAFWHFLRKENRFLPADNDRKDAEEQEGGNLIKGLYEITPEQEDLIGLIHDFMNKSIRPHVLEWEEQGHYPDEIVQAGIDMGLHMMQVPEEYGGLGLDNTTAALLLEEGGKVEGSYMGMFNVTSMGGKIVMACGSEKQKEYYAGLLQKGIISAFCLTEAGCGSDSAAVKTTAVRKGDKYIINGTKMFITNASIASVFLVVATVNPSLGAKGLATFIVERDRPGVSVGRKIEKMGQRLSNTAEVIFDEVEIPADNLIGTEETGFANAMKVLTASRPMVAASSLGACQLARDLAIQYSKERYAFGKPICRNQMIQEKIAEMEMMIQAGRGLVYNATRLLDQGLPCNVEASIAKLYVTESYSKIADMAVQIHGGYGVCNEYLISKVYRDSRVNRIVEGTTEIQKMIISKALLR